MSLIADGVLIVTCLTTAIYCYVLSARLRRLSNTDEGIGQQIAQLNSTLEETRSTLKEVRASAKTASDRLTRETGQANKVAAVLAKRVAEAEVVMSRAYQAMPAKTDLVQTPEDSVPQGPTPDGASEAVLVEEENEIEDLALADDVPEEDTDLAEDTIDDTEGGSYGAHQLGFLPELDDDDEEDDLSNAEGASDDLVVDPVPAGEPQGKKQGPGNEVMTVERVAL